MNIRKTTFFIILVMLITLGSACKKRRDLSYLSSFKNLSKDAFALVFTSSLEGYVEPCGCTSNPLGGIARMAQVFEDIKSLNKNKIQLIDAGNLLFDSKTRFAADECQDEARINLILTTLGGLGLKFSVPGPLDNSRGVEYRNNLFAKHKIKSLLFNQPQLIEQENFNIVLMGFDNPQVDKSKILPTIKPFKDSTKPHLIIALSQMPIEQSKSLFSEFNGIDLVIQGQIESMTPKSPIKLGENGPWLIEGGRQGQYFSVLLLQNLSLLKNKALIVDNRAFEHESSIELLKARIVGLEKQREAIESEKKAFIENRIKIAQKELVLLEKMSEFPALNEPNVLFNTIALTRKIDSLPRVHKELELYEKKIPALVKKCEANISCPEVSENEPSYVGVDTCKTCHPQAFDVWKNAVFLINALNEDGKEITRKVGHSKAWQTLVDDRKQSDRSCIGCHSIGFMKKGGYCKAFEVDFRVDVQCESCHGAGSLHAKTGKKEFISRQMSEEGCRGCHHVPHIPSYESFNYREKLMKVLGPGHGDKLLKQLQHSEKN